ncbi:penicillin-binding protein 2 [Kordiimonas sp. SCSIO 12610]|uniref:penicillin-binding protein 2 n=1 Tax=Kordiimonas sp. SCSIO 12610 TaxID=2829597 RepID=UPI00210872CC|nr:penicillin-binding protein 2 [Kordiimonas sp. SCSIO 12610]UTW54416.1 penicillin-binding protein 2 [Kordiimonas sp. SCSIO 12610]
MRYQLFSRRALLLAGGQGLVLSALGGRLYYLSVVEGEQYKVRADKNRISLRLIAPERGDILDRKGRKLATNRQDFRVFLVPEQTDDSKETLNKLGRIIDLSPRQLRRIERQIKRQRKFVPITVAEGLEWDEFARVNVDAPELPGVLTDAGLSRHYPNGNDVAHIVGYLASPDEDDVNKNPLYQLPGFKVGKQGLEDRFEAHLRGYAGTRRVEVNSVGREIRELPGRQDATFGDHLNLSIDLELQREATKILGEEAAGAVVIDIKSGELLALASTPTYDPNEFTRGISSQNWNSLLKDPRKPLVNKCVNGLYPPGSTVKMLMALSALEEGLVTPDTEYYCNGRHRLGDNTFHCWKRGGHGKLDLVGAISNSCDVYFYELAEKMDIDKIAEMANRFGLGQLHNIGVDGEKSGLVPTREWKERTRRERWQLGETLNVSIGQGALLATPLQLAVMTARIASGKEVKPSLFMASQSDYQDPFLYDNDFGRMRINPLHLDIVREGMERVTAVRGTAFDPKRPKTAQKIAGKTGTAQVRRITIQERNTTGVLDNKELPWASRDHALFVAYAPAEDPQFAVSILVQHGGGGASTAAPLGRALLDKAAEIRARAEPQQPSSLSEEV